MNKAATLGGDSTRPQAQDDRLNESINNFEGKWIEPRLAQAFGGRGRESYTIQDVAVLEGGQVVLRLAQRERLASPRL